MIYGNNFICNLAIYTYIRDTSTDGKSLYVYVIRLSRGFNVFGITSSDARLQVTNRLVSSQTHFSGHIPYAVCIRTPLPIHSNMKIEESILVLDTLTRTFLHYI